ASELRQRRRYHLDVVQEKRLHLLRITKERGVRVDFNLDLAVEVFLCELLELVRCITLGSVVGIDVTELDYHRLRVNGIDGQSHSNDGRNTEDGQSGNCSV